jgi:hypothetical protein
LCSNVPTKLGHRSVVSKRPKREICGLQAVSRCRVGAGTAWLRSVCFRRRKSLFSMRLFRNCQVISPFCWLSEPGQPRANRLPSRQSVQA